MNIYPYMLKPNQQLHITESYVSSPPALIISDERGDVFTLANEPPSTEGARGEFSFQVLRNGMPTGTLASRIERRGGRIRALTHKGWKHWTGVSFI